MAELPPYPGTPRWVNVSGIIAIIVILLFVALQLTGAIGRHGPGRHAPLGGSGGGPSTCCEDHTPGSSDAHVPRGGRR